MLILSWEQVEPWGADYDQADYLQVLGRWFVRGESFGLHQEATAKKVCQKRLDTTSQPFCLLVKSPDRITLWHETLEAPQLPAQADENKQPVRKFRGQVVQTMVLPTPAGEPVPKRYRGQVVPTTPASQTPETEPAPKMYRGQVVRPCGCKA
ncbi:MAG: hypothetical protein RMI89_11435 [Gloeomargarita sp. SKYBB_i_bin120]|nr:hypothetical protein [Gloeomargarita sp. SKYG98]MCS7293561.1 hypothetical protein [Gloeomargarita sp. SKYB120]MDW8179127.1 hypothetical protein [Gloeomargarita sp. SKYBB_i_bin120]